MGEHPAVLAARRAVLNVGHGDRVVPELAHRRGVAPLPREGAQRLRAALHRLDVPESVLREAGDVAWRLCNPSVAAHRGDLLVNVRLVEPDTVDSRHRTVNVIGRVDGSWRLADARILRTPPGPVQYEDVRLVSLGDRLVGCAAACDHRAPPQFAVLDIDDGAAGVPAVHTQPSPTMQKNWMPVVRGGALGFVYSVEPLTLVSYDAATGLVTPPAASLPWVPDGRPRGGSQLVPYEAGWLAVVHNVYRRNDGALAYLHRFARFDPGLTRVTLGRLWQLGAAPGIEFVAGLARYADRYVLSAGLDDRAACLAIVDEAVVRTMC